MKKFLQSWAINTLAVLAAVFIVPGIRFADNSFWAPFVTSLILGILNAFIRPVLTLLALPLMIYTLGLFRLVINALLLYFVGLLMGPHLQIDSFFAAFAGALIISLISFLLNLLTGTARARAHFKHHSRPPDAGPGGSGPVIDV